MAGNPPKGTTSQVSTAEFPPTERTAPAHSESFTNNTFDIAKELDTLDHRNLELVTELRHELHHHPELSNHETWTKQHLIDFLRKHTKLEIVDRGLWFYAIYWADRDENGTSKPGKPRQSIAFRADFDAIKVNETIDLPYGSECPGVSHKCGHDGHSAALAGLALEIDQKGSDKNVFFLFQHAEETGDGAAQCATFIDEHKIDEIYAYHNWSGVPLKSVSVIDGTSNCASKGMTIHMKGTPSHASRPEMGRNPAYAIANIISAIPDLIAPGKNKGLVLCTVIQVAIGERAFGVSASEGDLLLTIRALYEEEMDRLQANIENLAKTEAEKYGLEVSFTYNDVFPETSNNKESSDKIRKVCRDKGIELIEMKEAHRGSEDFGHFLKRTQGAIFYVGNGENHADVHTAGYDFPDEIIETAVEVWKGLIDLK